MNDNQKFNQWYNGNKDRYNLTDKFACMLAWQDAISQQYSWKSIEYELPKIAVDVLAYREDDGWMVICYLDDDGNFSIEPYITAHAITHWMLLPEPPKPIV